MNRWPNLANKPLIIGIGAQRTGTGWLAIYLAEHPEIYMSTTKELHFFDAKYDARFEHFDLKMQTRLATFDQLAEKMKHSPNPNTRRKRKDDLVDRVAMRSDDDYLAFFNKRVSSERAFCEISPSYAMLSSEIFRRMGGIHTDVRFIYIMRNPADRIWSQIRFQKKRLEIAIAEFELCLQRDEMVMRTDYASTIEAITAAIPRHKILFLFHEQLFSATAASRICQFIGVSPRDGRYRERVNATGLQAAMTRDMRRLAYQRFASVYSYVETFFHGDIPENWKLDMRAFGGTG
jgi:hypothetical protein